LPGLSNLGELQPSYQDFGTVLLETKQILSSGYYQKKKAALEQDLQYLVALRNNTVEQKQLLNQDKELQKKEYDAYASLAKEKVIAPLELNQYKSKLLAKQQSMEQADAQITNSDISSHNKRKELLDLQKFVSDQQQKFHSSLLNLQNEIDKWMQQYIVMAPEHGKVFFINSLQENQLVSSGQELFYVQSGQGQYYGELMAAQNGLGKIKKGQKVLLRADSYPDAEYGYLTGRVNYISNLPNRKDSFLIKLDLPHGLQTSYHKEIFFRNSLSAKAEIITDDRRLLDRLLGQLREVWKE
ncbi:MAG: HlyD family efflux transporter periplasmic adaptor subunit, partial [Flavisolibacter sp.]